MKSPALPQQYRAIGRRQVESENRPAKGVGVTLPGGLKYAPKVEVLFDNRSLLQSGGRFQDDFEPYSRRVYCVTID